MIEYRATANLSEFLLNINRIRDAMMTIGVAAKWNQPRNFGGAIAANLSRSLASLFMSQLYAFVTGFKSRTDLTESVASAANSVSAPVTKSIVLTPNNSANGPAAAMPRGDNPKEPKAS